MCHKPQKSLIKKGKPPLLLIGFVLGGLSDTTEHLVWTLLVPHTIHNLLPPMVIKTTEIEESKSPRLRKLTKGSRFKRRNSLFHVNTNQVWHLNQAKSKSAPAGISFATDEVQLRENCTIRSKHRTRNRKSKSLTHAKECEEETPESFCTPRTIQTLPLVESCIAFMKSEKRKAIPNLVTISNRFTVYKVKGIFRECGNYINTQNALSTLRNTLKEKHTEYVHCDW